MRNIRNKSVTKVVKGSASDLSSVPTEQGLFKVDKDTSKVSVTVGASDQELGIIDPNTDSRIVRVLTPPTISGDTSNLTPGKTLLLASGSVSLLPNKPLISYIWTIKGDDRVYKGDILTIDTDVNEDNDLEVSVYAIDHLGNESITVTQNVSRITPQSATLTTLPSILKVGQVGSINFNITGTSYIKLKNITNIEFSKTDNIVATDVITFKVPDTVPLSDNVIFDYITVTPGVNEVSETKTIPIGVDVTLTKASDDIYYGSTGSFRWTSSLTDIVCNVSSYKNVVLSKTELIPLNTDVTITPVGDITKGYKNYFISVDFVDTTTGKVVDNAYISGKLKANVPDLDNAYIEIDGTITNKVNVCDSRQFKLKGAVDPLGGSLKYSIKNIGSDKLTFSKTENIGIDEAVTVTLDCNYLSEPNTPSAIALKVYVSNNTHTSIKDLAIVATDDLHKKVFTSNGTFVKPQGIRMLQIKGKGSGKSSKQITSLNKVSVKRTFTDATVPQTDFHLFDGLPVDGSTYAGKIIINPPSAPFIDLNVYDGFTVTEQNNNIIYFFATITSNDPAMINTLSGSYTKVTDTTELTNLSNLLGIPVNTQDYKVFKEVKSIDNYVREMYLIYHTQNQLVDGKPSTITGPITKVYPGEPKDNTSPFNVTVDDIATPADEQTYTITVPPGGYIEINY